MMLMSEGVEPNSGPIMGVYGWIAYTVTSIML